MPLNLVFFFFFGWSAQSSQGKDASTDKSLVWCCANQPSRPRHWFFPSSWSHIFAAFHWFMFSSRTDGTLLPVCGHLDTQTCLSDNWWAEVVGLTQDLVRVFTFRFLSKLLTNLNAIPTMENNKKNLCLSVSKVRIYSEINLLKVVIGFAWRYFPSQQKNSP